LTFTYTVSIPANQSGPAEISGDVLYFLSGMTNTAFAPAAPEPMVVTCTNPYVYSNTNCAACAPSGLIAWWPGDLNAYDIVGTNNGTLENGATFGPGVVGEAFNFGGSGQCVSVPNSASWCFGTNDFSIDLWANFAANNGTYALLADDDGGGWNTKWIFWLNGTTLQLHVNTLTGNYAYIGSGSFTPDLGQWYHLAMVRSGNSFLFYDDGMLLSSNWVAVVIPSPATPLTIGQAENWYYFNGSMDDVRIYNRALSFSEIEAIYRAGTNGMCAATPPRFGGPPLISGTDGVILSAHLRSGRNYELEASTNLASTNWVVITNFTAGSDPTCWFTNQAATSLPRQFYRIVSP
jgi:hypothetical protein